MTVTQLEIGTFPVPFKVVFKHTSAARAATENVIVRVTSGDGSVGHGEGCPRSYVTGETQATAMEFLESFGPGIVANVEDMNSLREQLAKHQDDIDQNPAAFCALELALLDMLSRRSDQTVEALVGARSSNNPFTYSAVLSDSGPAVFGAQILRYRANGLRHYKLKISGDLHRDQVKLRWFRGRLGRWVGESVRIDANNLWLDADEAIDYLRKLDYPFLGIEEPLKAGDHPNFLAIAEALDTRIILDESLLRSGQLADLPGAPERWILNCRISKSGGLLRSLDLIDRSVAHGLGVIVGAHVGETSLLTRAATIAATAAGKQLIAQEGAFGTILLADDICDDPIMFSRGGRLSQSNHAAFRQSGLGVDVLADRLAGMRTISA